MSLTKVARGTPVATVIFQCDPAQACLVVLLWYCNYSFRTYGDLDCFSRLEITDDHYHRQHNVISVVYSVGELIEYSVATGDYSKLTEPSLRGLRGAYPDSEMENSGILDGISMLP